jgi:prepilin peptidase CpaA
MLNVTFTGIILGVFAFLLLIASAIDIKIRKIPNRLNLVIALLAPLFWLAAGLPLWPDAAIQLAVAAAVFGLMMLAFMIGMMGGGDVKMAAAIALWFAPSDVLRFLIFMSLAGGLVTLATMAWHKGTKREGKAKVPYGVAIAIGALAILAQRFLNQFA